MMLLRRKPSTRADPTTHPDIRVGHRYADILDTTEDGRLRIDYGQFHETLEEQNIPFVD